MLGAAFPTPGGVPWRPMVSMTLRTYAATALASLGLIGIAGMPDVLPAAVDDRDDHFAVLVAERDLRTQQIRAAHVAAAQVGAVAAGATDAVKRLAAFDSARDPPGGRCCPGTKPPRPPPPRPPPCAGGTGAWGGA